MFSKEQRDTITTLASILQTWIIGRLMERKNKQEEVSKKLNLSVGAFKRYVIPAQPDIGDYLKHIEYYGRDEFDQIAQQASTLADGDALVFDDHRIVIHYNHFFARFHVIPTRY